MKRYLPLILLTVGLLIGFAGGFYFKTYQQSKQRPNFMNGNSNTQRFVPNGGSREDGQGRVNFGGATEGDIISIDEKSITVKLLDGSTKIIFLGDTTTYSNISDSKKEDLKIGIKVAVFGSSNTDGSLTAQRIQLNPIVVSPLPQP